MAQQREKEESELKVPKNLSLCAPPPIPIPPPKLDESASSSDLQENQAIHALPTAGTNDPRYRSRSSEDLSQSQSQSQSQVAETEELENQPKRRSREVNRCSGCRRKVGLTGFRCRCGDLFCSEHRYSDRHDCTFDYKAAGREAIARDNPLVRPAKILKV